MARKKRGDNAATEQAAPAATAAQPAQKAPAGKAAAPPA
ncbi:hypothetical protein BESB_067950 [Besnoitia besnoiti]|uniref:Uncharacterized protein n=1 Tax=Besnoitia besnoiti TaxID=94643 RepID=A0A2A9MH79_BESBE|nr:hypothetical protein BESB_067950 [Besnoitia besnoiti]PFH34762.1 hypothetical protein BESB_067950 [Besnoitia besnoiti]